MTICWLGLNHRRETVDHTLIHAVVTSYWQLQMLGCFLWLQGYKLLLIIGHQFVLKFNQERNNYSMRVWEWVATFYFCFNDESGMTHEMHGSYPSQVVL